MKQNPGEFGYDLSVRFHPLAQWREEDDLMPPSEAFAIQFLNRSGIKRLLPPDPNRRKVWTPTTAVYAAYVDAWREKIKHTGIDLALLDGRMFGILIGHLYLNPTPCRLTHNGRKVRGFIGLDGPFALRRRPVGRPRKYK